MENLTEENIRIIFGLKVKKLRTEKGFTFQQLANACGVSVSYLNEIENGKKYPKAEKISDIARALDTSYDQLISLKLSRSLAPVGHFLSLDVINDFLFNSFGIDKSTLLGMVANEPIKVSAFINAIFEIARNYNLKQEHFYFACLRSYQELNDNYFEEIEDAVDNFVKETKFKNALVSQEETYRKILAEKFRYNIEATDFADFPKLKNMRSVFVKNGISKLLFNKKLTEQQQAFLFGREIGFSYLKLEKRPYTTSWLTVDSFDHVLNNFKASYFAQALHIPKASLINDLESFLQAEKFQAAFFTQLLNKYNASPEMLLTRISNILPKYFEIHELFFIRYSSKDQEKNLKEISKELHLSRNSVSLEYSVSEQNYRRWITKSLVKYLSENKTNKEKTKIEAVISENGNGNQYLTISILRTMPELNNNNNSVTLGFVLTDAVKKKINFLNDPFLKIAKLGDLSKNEFETPLEIRIMKEQTEKETEFEKLKAVYKKNNI